MEEFPALELLPADTDVFSLDEELAELADPEDVPDFDVEEETLPVGRTWFIDLETGTGGPSPAVLRGNDAVVMLAQIALRTRRGEHVIFDDEFGMDDPEGMLGFADEAERRALYERDVSETLLACHDRITNVSDFLFIRDPDEEEIYVDLSIEIDGDEEVRLEGVQVV